MKKIGIFILIYNIVFMSCSSCKWYADLYNIIDFLDMPIYLLSAIVFFKFWWNKFKGMTIFEFHCFISIYLLLVLKIAYFLFTLNYQTYEFWFWLIAVAPILFKIERNINYENT